jgi:sortase A
LNKRKLMLVASALLMAAGAALICYPLFLRVQTSLAQARLEKEFEKYPPYIEAERETQPTPEEPEPEPEPEPAAPQWEKLPPTLLEIPAIDLSVQLEAVEDMGAFARKLSQMPSYYPQSSMPGEVGNVLIAGHRGGPAGYFGKLKNLQPGAQIILHAPGISYYYEVEKVFKVKPTAVEVLDPLDYPAITLTTCYSSTRRLIVRGRFLEYVLNTGE